VAYWGAVTTPAQFYYDLFLYARKNRFYPNVFLCAPSPKKRNCANMVHRYVFVLTTDDLLQDEKRLRKMNTALGFL
jgi:hypothetical protein